MEFNDGITFCLWVTSWKWVNGLCCTGLAVSARHPYMFSAGDDKQVKCWDLEYNKVTSGSYEVYWCIVCMLVLGLSLLWSTHVLLEDLTLKWVCAGYPVISWTFEWSLLLSASSYTWYSHDWRTRLSVSGMVLLCFLRSWCFIWSLNICGRLRLELKFLAHNIYLCRYGTWEPRHRFLRYLGTRIRSALWLRRLL